jgi:uncharacterized GH25 family protein
MKKKMITLFLLFALTSLVNAHEFWLQPAKFRYASGELVNVDFMVGENFTGEFWDMKRHQVEMLQLHSLSESIDLVQTIKKTEGKNLSIKIEKEGTHMVTLRSNAAFIELEADKFNDYLKEDGLEYILEKRKATNTLSKPAREHYIRFAKLLVQAGNELDDTYKKRVGMRIEIVPAQNPYALKTGDYLQCLILFEGKPLPHTLVKVWSRVNNTTFLQNIYTESNGTLKFPISTRGAWMVSTVKMIAAEKPGADWQSMWGSLVFGIE